MLGLSHPNTKTIKDNYAILSQQLHVFDNAHNNQRQAGFLPALTCASLFDIATKA
jgi:hypothetical protein